MANSFKHIISDISESLGYAIIPNWRREHLPLADRLRTIFAKRKITTVIDVGANRGQYRDFLRQEVGFAGRIESFEPIPELAEELKRRATGDAQWIVHARALGAQQGELSLNVMQSTTFSSFRQPIAAGSPSQRVANTVSRQVTVPVSTLDSEFAGRDLSHSYLKLDTQGFDLEVLRGAERGISLIPALQTEVSFFPFYSNMPTYIEALAAFQQRGFAVADFFLVSTDESGRAMEFDCVMVR